jgi:hypothetical protein
MNELQKTTKNTILWEKLQNLIENHRNTGNMDTSDAHIHDWLISWFGTGTSIKVGVTKLVAWAQASPNSEMMRSCKYFAHVSSIPSLTYDHSNSVIIGLNAFFPEFIYV